MKISKTDLEILKKFHEIYETFKRENLIDILIAHKYAYKHPSQITYFNAANVRTY